MLGRSLITAATKAQRLCDCLVSFPGGMEYCSGTEDIEDVEDVVLVGSMNVFDDF